MSEVAALPLASLFDTLHRLFVEPLSLVAHQKALIGGGLVAIACAVIGCFVILRRMAFLGDALSHSMLAGVAAGYLLMQAISGKEAHAPAMLLGSLIAGLVTVSTINFISRVSRIKDDTAIGIMYTGIFAIGGVLASVFADRIHIHLYDFIVGNVLAIRDENLWMMACIAAGVLATVVLFFRHFQITTFDPVMAASIGISVVLFDYLLTTCASLVVVGAVSVVGVILVVGLLVTPAATAYLLCDRLSRMLVVSACFGVSSVFVGLYGTIWLANLDVGVATGPAIVLASTAQFLIVLAISPQYGLVADWWRRRNRVPQQLMEDILGCIMRAKTTTVALAEIQKHVSGHVRQIRRALRSMERDDLMEISGSQVTLTKSGHREARRLLRSHRLWEAYLARVGTPQTELHEQAHKLEHFHDEETVDYLDDKLGHPLKDPHGAEIPEDFVHLVPGTDVRLSLLRNGHRGTIKKVGQLAIGLQLRTGELVTLGPRHEEDNLWQLILPTGKRVMLTHEQADDVLVEYEPSSHSEGEAK